MDKILLYFFSLSSLLCLTQCSVEELVGEAKVELEEQYKTLPHYESLPTKSLTWNEAKKQLLENNLDIQRARNEIQVAKDNVTRIYADLIPMANLGFYYNKALNNNKSNYYYDSQDFNYNINIIFNLPALTQLPVDHYMAELALFRAEKNKELKERELISQLYKILQETKLSEQKYILVKNNEYRKSEDDSEVIDIDKRRALEQRQQWMTLSALLNNAHSKWTLSPHTLPCINMDSYRKKSQHLDDLILTMMALELEASRLRQLGIKLQYWPTVHLNFYSPSLFNMTGGNNNGFMGKDNDLRMDLNFYIQLDTRLNIYRQLKQAKADHAVLIQTLKMQMLERREKIAQILQSEKDYQYWQSTMKKLTAFHKKQGEIDAESLTKRHKEQHETELSLIDQNIQNIEREASLIMEYGL